MNLSINRKKKTLFIYKNMPKMGNLGNINILLSPEFYWIQKVKLPVKFTFQAKKFSNSVFEGLLPEGNYEYLIIKESDEFLFLAYDLEKLKEFLISKDIKIESVSKIYFTDLEKEFFKKPVDLGEKVLIDIEGEATILNKKFIADTTLYPLNRNYTPKSTYATIHTISFISKKQIYILSGITILATFLNFIEALRYNIELSKMNKSYQKFIEESKLPTSSYQLDSIHNKYKNIDKKQKKIREVTTKIIKTITKYDGIIEEFDLKDGKVTILVSAKNNSIYNSIKAELGKIGTKQIMNNILHIKVNLNES